MQKKLSKFLITLLLLIMSCPFNVYGAEPLTLDDSLNGIVAYYENNKTSLSNWEEVVGLNLAGADLSGNWQMPDWNVTDLEYSSSSGTYATTIMGLLAAGDNPQNIEGRNIVAELVNKQSVNGDFGSQITDTIWAIVALDQVRVSYNTEEAINYLIDQQLPDNGFALSGQTADSDITGFTLIALGAHSDIPGASEAIAQAKTCLQNMQLDDGGFSSFGTENTESVAAVIRGLVACGEDIASDVWKKNGKTMIDALYSFQLEDKSFAHILGGSHNDMSTRQALLAVAVMVDAGIDYTIGQDSQGGDDPNSATVQVIVEGNSNSLSNTSVTVSGSALDALKEAVGEANIQLDNWGMISSILEVSGQTNIIPGTDTSWMYYVIRNGAIEPSAFSEGPSSYTIQDGDQIIFYIGAYDNSTYEGKTYFSVITASPANPSAGQDVTLQISAQKYDYAAGLVELSVAKTTAIGDYTVEVGGTEYTSSNGQVTIPDVAQGALSFVISNSNAAGYPDVVTYYGRIDVEAAPTVQVRVEGAVEGLSNETVTVSGSALDALREAVGEANIQLDNWGMISSILGVSGQTNIVPGTDTSWMYYVIRNGAIEPSAFNEGPSSYNIQDGDQIIFYIGAYNNSTWEGQTYFPIITVNPAAPIAGQSITLQISAQKYDYTVGLVELSAAEKNAIGEYRVKVGGTEYTSSNGQVTIPSVAQGTLSYIVSNPNAAGYPDVITYQGKIEISNASGGESPEETEMTVYVAVVGKNNNLLYGPDSVTIAKDGTAMDALIATGLSTKMNPGQDNMLIGVAGEMNEGSNGWMYKINGVKPMTTPYNYNDAYDEIIDFVSGSKLIFWYSTDPDSDGPSWEDLENLPSGSSGSQISDEVKTEIEEALNSYQTELEKLVQASKTSGTPISSRVINSENRMTPDKVAALQDKLKNNKVDLTNQEVDQEGAVLADSNQEVSLLVPQNALTESRQLSIKELDVASIYQSGNIKIGSSIYDFGPNGTKFDKPVTIRINVAITEDMDINSLAPAWYDDAKGEWIPIPGIIDLKNGMVVFEIDHFTKFALIELAEEAETVAAEPDRITFNDVTDDIAWAKDAIELLAGKGIIKGTAEGLFEPQRSISRAEFIQLLYNAVPLEKQEYSPGLYTDIQASDWFAAAIASAAEKQLVSGYPDNTFKPNNIITRNEVACIFSKLLGDAVNSGEESALNFNDQNEIPSWADAGVKFVYRQRLMSGYSDQTFKGNNPLTRAEAAVIIYQYLNSAANQ